MLRGFTVLLLLLCAGEAASRALRLPVPGAVVGMALALGLLIWRPRLAGVLEGAADLLIRHLSLLFVPAGVGVVAIASGLSGEWPAIVVTLLVSATLAVLVTAACTMATARWLARRGSDIARGAPAQSPALPGAAARTPLRAGRVDSADAQADAVARPAGAASAGAPDGRHPESRGSATAVSGGPDADPADGAAGAGGRGTADGARRR